VDEIETPGNYPKENILYSEHGESLKSTRFKTLAQEINPWAAHTPSCWRVNSCKRGVKKQKRAQEILFCQGREGSQVCESQDFSFTVQRFVPRVPSNPTPFWRTRSLYLTVFVMMRHCLKLQPLKWKTDVNETCSFPFYPVCYLYMPRDLEMEKCCLRRVEWIYCYMAAIRRVLREEILYIEAGCRVC